jgi:magnesium-transporting ATPase (P-type)
VLDSVEVLDKSGRDVHGGIKMAAAQTVAKRRDEEETSLRVDEIVSLPIDEVFARLNTSQSGLTSQEVENRLKIYGHNELAKRKRRSGFVELLRHFRNPLVLILLIAGLISGFTGDVTDATIIFSIIVVSVVLDVYQESKAENAAEALQERVATTATVIRDSVKKEVKLSEIVPGDVVVLSAGDIVPADARVIVAKDLFVNQSALTGESFPVEKTPEPLKAKSAKTEDVVNSLEGLTIQSPIGPITMRACDNRAITPVFWGQIASLPNYPFPVMKDLFTISATEIAPTCEEIAELRKARK